jgi:hypothetical protein
MLARIPLHGLDGGREVPHQSDIVTREQQATELGYVEPFETRSTGMLASKRRVVEVEAVDVDDGAREIRQS